MTVKDIIALVFFALLLAGCETRIEGAELVWAINVGGDAYEGVDGTNYGAEASIQGGEIHAMEIVKGSQDAFLYRSYRGGDIEIAHGIADGIYDITLHFAEPDEVGGGERVFNALIEDSVVIRDLDIMASRDGKIHSALTVTIPDVAVSDGELNIHFEAATRQPVLSALVVRNKHRRADSWELVWSDEFDKGPLDADKWSIEEWPARKVNDEDQTYTNRSKNIHVADGHLVIDAFKEDFNNAAYTSGRVHSSGKADFLYGRFEVRAKLPAGKGSWPAIWMLPSDPYFYSTTCTEGEDWQGSSSCNAWPNSGEIDIMEHVGYQMGHIHGTVHNEAYYWAKWEQRKGRILLDDVDSAFHIYAIEWSPERIDAFVDDTLYFSYINENNGWRTWPYDKPFHLIMNIAVGGAWGRAGGGIDDDIFPLQMLVDYARVYQLPE
jgi:beta-glucanase (GH16 family)